MNIIISAAALAAITVSSTAFGGLSFTDIATNENSGINYQHGQTSRHDVRQAQHFLPSQQAPISIIDVANMPIHVAGKSGVLLLDYDNDGDVDIFATNVTGMANSLFQNQLSNTGQLSFIDMAAQAGIDSPEHQGSGACYADVDNDGDHDIFVVGDDDSHRLYENNGNGTFTDITVKSGSTFTSSTKGGTVCVFGDVDNDGFVDLHVAHAWDFDTGIACFAEPFALNVANELFHNNNDNTFMDISTTSGIQNLGVVPPGAQTITWAAALVDYDQDGDLDLFNADDSCAMPAAAYGGVDRGLIQVWDNDGSGNFSNVTVQVGTDKPGHWMGIDFADFNHDGNLDFFATNMGDYMPPVMNSSAPLGSTTSRMFTGNGDGSFSDPGAGALVATPFGWGTTAEDFDNDGDTDVMFAGGIDVGVIITADNPGSLLLNDGTANFTYDSAAFEDRTTRQNIQGVATGDINNDGFVDIVTTSNFAMPSFFPLIPSIAQFGGPFDEAAFFVPMMNMVGPGIFSWSGLIYNPGVMSVQINQPSSLHKSISVQTKGSVGLIANGAVNRSGIGAIVSFTPTGGNTAIKPVAGGASHASQSTHQLNFGMGSAKRGTVDVFWPGGVRNRLYKVRGGENIIFPEIPCSIDTDNSVWQYLNCTYRSLKKLEQAGVLTKKENKRFLISALRAYLEEHKYNLNEKEDG
ncbi:MAG: CRTAC1 family protein [Gammaproteobacteria bacterium]|nr:CRTAC1 family protein [Gammaproteobacteria bacterium]